MTDPFGRYELVRLLGRGAAGEVWEAWLRGPLGFRRPVALKLLRQGPEEARRELVQEARLGALLSHPNVVSIYEVGEVDGRWFMAMELVQGGALSQARIPLSPRAVVEVGLQVAAGLSHIHSLNLEGRPAGLVHRDIKPANLLVTPQGLVMIADLGIARLAGTDHSGMGTPGYMPAEQLRGQEDARADLFALGVTLYRLLTGKPLFPGGPQGMYAVSVADRFVEAERLLEPVERLQPDLAEVIARCVRLRPEERWPDADALGGALGRLVGPDLLGPPLARHLDLSAPPPEPQDVERRATRKGPPGPPFIGRQQEVERLVGLLERERMVVLTGPGGMGKSRLAFEVSQRLAPRLPGGVVHADVYEAVSDSGICAAVARALGVALSGGDPPEELVAPLRARGCSLLVVDNAERVAAGVAEVVARWLDRAPDLTVLVTTQVPLPRNPGHREVLGPLDDKEAAALFQRASGARPPPELLSRMEGLPLAIELAAARARLHGLDPSQWPLQPEEAAPSTTLPGRPERHRSLRASLEATWALLPKWGPACMAQLSVFADGFTLQAADAVVDLHAWPQAPWTLDALTQLVALSLVTLDPDTQRFGLGQVVQAYARETCPEEAEAAERRHGAWFAQLGTPFALVTVTQRSGRALKAQLEADLENVLHAARAAIRRGDGPVATACALAARRVLETQGPVAAGEALLAEVEPLAGARRSEVETTRAWMNLLLGRLDQAAALAVRARERARRDGDRRQEGLAEMYLGLLAYMEGEARDAVDCLRRAVLLFDRLGDRYLQAVALQNLGVAYDGDPEGAVEIHEATAVLAEAIGDDRLTCLSLANTGHTRHLAGLQDADGPLERALELAVAQGSARQEGIVRVYRANRMRDRGELRAARAEVHQAIERLQAVGERRMVGYARCVLGQVLLESGEPEEALRCVEEGMALAAGMATGRHFRLQRAQALYALGRRDEALRDLEEAIRWLRTSRDGRYLAQALAIRAAWTRSPADLTEAEQVLGDLKAETTVLRSLEAARQAVGGARPGG